VFQEHLLTYKNWAILMSTFFSVPLCIVCHAVNLNLTWTYYFTGILISRQTNNKNRKQCLKVEEVKEKV
jgi:hypothetical protein